MATNIFVSFRFSDGNDYKKELDNLFDNTVSVNNYSEDEVVIASFGHIHETKRAIPILKAFALLCEKYSNLRYNFVGKLDQSIKNEFEEFVQKHNLKKIINHFRR